MNPKLRLWLMNRSSKQGFAMPVALMLGLFIMLIGIAVIAKTKNTRDLGISQVAGAESLAVAETALTRYQTLINENRALATYCAHSSDNSEDTACNTGTTWSNIDATKLKGAKVCGTETSLVNLVQTSAATTWQNLETNDPSKGQYRLVSYKYKPEDNTKPNQAPGKGILIIEGRVKQDGSGDSANKDIGRTATTRLEVEIPVKNPTGAIPGVWLQSGNLGNNSVSADVFLSDCSTNPNSININGSYQAKHIGWDFPTLPPIPNSEINDLGHITTSYTLPRVGTDTSKPTVINGQTVDVYRYKVNSITGNNTIITITPGAHVTFYLTGNIEPQGNSEIIHSCTNSSGQAIADCRPTDFQIYGYGALGSKICLIGNKVLETFILGPNYTAGVAGSGGGSGGVKGSIWVYNWSTGGGCGSQTSNAVVQQTATWDEMATGFETLPPRIRGLSSWDKRTVSD